MSSIFKNKKGLGRGLSSLIGETKIFGTEDPTFLFSIACWLGINIKYIRPKTPIIKKPAKAPVIGLINLDFVFNVLFCEGSRRISKAWNSFCFTSVSYTHLRAHET